MKPHAPTPPAIAGPNDLIGSLRVASLFDLAQFLLLSAKSGTLTLFLRGGVSRLFFRDGEIVNAVDDRKGREGRDVALRLFRAREGGFRFRQEEVGEARRIDDATENLLLEAARQIDEIAEAVPGAAGEASAERELREKQEKGEAIRRLFSSLEEDLGRGGSLPVLEKLLGAAGAGGAEALFLAAGESPALLRGSRVVGHLPGRVAAEEIGRLAPAAEGEGAFRAGGVAWLARAAVDEGWVAFRRCGPAATLEEANLAEEALGRLFRSPGGFLFLVAESEPLRRYLYDAFVRYAGRRREAMISLDRETGGAEGFLARPRAGSAGAREERRLRSLCDALPAARVLLRAIRGKAEARTLLELARSDHTVVTTLPGREGADALRRASSWFARPGAAVPHAGLIRGIVALRPLPSSSGRAVPVTSIAPWSDEAARALAGGEYARLGALLEEAAGDDGFAASLRRLAEKGSIEKSEADRAASLVSSWISVPPPAATPPPRRRP